MTAYKQQVFSFLFFPQTMYSSIPPLYRHHRSKKMEGSKGIPEFLPLGPPLKKHHILHLAHPLSLSTLCERLSHHSSVLFLLLLFLPRHQKVYKKLLSLICTKRYSNKMLISPPTHSVVYGNVNLCSRGVAAVEHAVIVSFWGLNDAWSAFCYFTIL